MMSKQADEEAIFQIARTVPTPEARADYLTRACGEDAALRDRLEALLRVHDQEPSFLRSAPPLAGDAADEPVTARAGAAVGPYELLERIGEGGMGVVWKARQQTLNRLCAVKMIRA